ncbi:putative leucine-rich repeat-containing protein DDB_G0290503 isoform X2 [Orussus abietinus]|uniref:putative leucine-rich repeat-containing protein DDB_G0290503 isoform X2 n=1 Tax=Orussus abietinus TaxID=222816 RepID=UPI000625CD4D|nr:putative leucine-rich repeat-containing protein DDB_G0290503 isoform X2 [Orussus abietinus]
MEIVSTEMRLSGDYSEYRSPTSSRDVPASDNCADVKLTELEHQLMTAETRCGSLKSQLDYMKMLYEGTQPAAINPREILDYSILQETFYEDEQAKDVKEDIHESYVSQMYFQRSPASTVKESERLTCPVHTKGHEFLEEINKAKLILKESEEQMKVHFESPTGEGIPLVIDDHTNDDNKEELEKSPSDQCFLSNTWKETLDFIDTTHRTVVLSPKPITTTDKNDICRELVDNDMAGSRLPYQQYLTEYSRGLENEIANVENNVIQLASEGKKGHTSECASSRKEGRRQQLVLKISGSAENSRGTQETKRKKILKAEKRHRATNCATISKKSSFGKIDDTASMASKIRRKRGKLRSANSKSTIATRDTNTTIKREPIKRKQRGPSTISSLQSSQRQPALPRTHLNWSEVVEIYHNQAVKSTSMSLVSSKHSKIDPRHGDTLPKNDPLPIEPIEESRINYKKQSKLQPSPKNHCQQKPDTVTGQTALVECPLLDQTTLRNDLENPQSSSIQNGPMHYDPAAARNYELPTVASKLKRVNRPYFGGFNFRNIPFVVGTSISPSHNLGLNIQQVLSIMKTRQPLVSGITPLLIRKVSKGMKPMSMLLDQMNRCNNSVMMPIELGDSNALKTTNNPNAQILEIPIKLKSKEQSNGYTNTTRETVSYLRPMQFTSWKSIGSYSTKTPNGSPNQRQEELNTSNGRNIKNQNGLQNTKEIQAVLINLYNQFEEMNTRYENLQEQVERSNNRTLAKELADLEKQLIAKEEEINAFVSLYKEVMALKQQIETLHQRNSFVYIATNSATGPPACQCHSPITRRSNYKRAYPAHKGNTTSQSSRELSTATRLTALLRQIQMFQKQLTLST